MEKIENTVTKKEDSRRPKQLGHIRLNEKSLSKAQTWSKQLNEAYPSLEFSQTHLVNAMIETLSDSLSKSDLQNLNKRFFNKSKLLKWVSEQIKISEKNGTDFDPSPHLKLLINDGATDKKRTRKTPKVKPELPKTQTDSEQKSPPSNI